MSELPLTADFESIVLDQRPLIDVRAPVEFASGAFPGAVNLPLMDDEDRARGFIESKDRQGKPQRFPMLSASIGVIDLTITTIDHPGEASAIAGELKKAVKKREGSNFMVNRRKSLKA